MPDEYRRFSAVVSLYGALVPDLNLKTMLNCKHFILNFINWKEICNKFLRIFKYNPGEKGKHNKIFGTQLKCHGRNSIKSNLFEP